MRRVPKSFSKFANRIVHPPKRMDDDWPDGPVLLECWQLVMEYTELVLLRLLGYQGFRGTSSC